MTEYKVIEVRDPLIYESLGYVSWNLLVDGCVELVGLDYTAVEAYVMRHMLPGDTFTEQAGTGSATLTYLEYVLAKFKVYLFDNIYGIDDDAINEAAALMARFSRKTGIFEQRIR